MKKFIFAICMLFASNSWACQITSTGDMTDAEVAHLRLECETRKAAAKERSGSTLSKAEEVNEWVSIGARIGEGIASAAGKLGVAVNDFIKTPAGILTILFILGAMFYKPFLVIVASITLVYVAYRLIRHTWHYEETNNPEGKIVVRRLTWDDANDSLITITIIGIAVVVAAIVIMVSTL